MSYSSVILDQGTFNKKNACDTILDPTSNFCLSRNFFSPVLSFNLEFLLTLSPFIPYLLNEPFHIIKLITNSAGSLKELQGVRRIDTFSWESI